MFKVIPLYAALLAFFYVYLSARAIDPTEVGITHTTEGIAEGIDFKKVSCINKLGGSDV
jgi:hypothetical protein